MTKQMDRIIAAQRQRLMAAPWPVRIRHANGSFTVASTNDPNVRGATVSCEEGSTCSECAKASS